MRHFSAILSSNERQIITGAAKAKSSTLTSSDFANSSTYHIISVTVKYFERFVLPSEIITFVVRTTGESVFIYILNKECKLCHSFSLIVHLCIFCEWKRFAEEGSATLVRPLVAGAVAGQEIESKTQFYYDDILFL